MFFAVAAFAWGGEPIDSPDSLIARAVADGYWAARADSAAPEGFSRGARFRLRGIEILDESGEALPGSSVKEWRGEPATRRNLEALRASVHDALLNGGFPYAETEMTLRPDSAGAPAADVALRARRGPSVKLGAPEVSGTRTRPDAVRRLALWEEGEDFSPERIARGVQRLARTGYFESADWAGLYRDPRRNLLYPVLRLPDARANSVGGLLGYDSEEGGGPSGYLDVRLFNIRGTARDFAFTFDSRTAGGAREREARVAYTEPWIAGSPVGARYEGSYLQLDTLFWEWDQSLFVFRDLDFASRVEAEFGAQENRSVGADADAALRTRAYRSGLRVVRDTRDRAAFTRTGARAAAGVIGLRRDFADSAYYLAQFRLSVERWRPLGERLGLKLATRAASNFPLDRLNRGELHDVGGARSLRGYREREFQTNAYFLSDAELWYGVGRRGRLFGFASPGFVNRPSGRVDPRRVLGYGAGVELARGDWSLALTYALNPERSFGDAFLHAAVENRF